MERSAVLLASIICATLVGVSLSVLNTIAQVSDFRPIRVSGTWTLGAEEGTWSAELGLDGRSLFGDVTVVGDETFDVGQVDVNITPDGDADGELSFDGEVVAYYAGFMKRGGMLEGRFETTAGEEGEWSGEWRGVAPTAENGWVAQTPQSSRDETSGTTTRALRGRTSRAVVVDPNKLVSAAGDIPAPNGENQVEVEVAADRSGNSSRIAAVAIDAVQFPNVSGVRPDLAYYISADDGVTWPASLKGNFPGLTGLDFGADPAIEYDRNGDLFSCGLVADTQITGNESIFLSRMPSGTSSFLNAKLVTTFTPAQNQGLDKPWCTTGLTNEATPRDIVYVAYVRTNRNLDPDETSIDFKFSTDAGTTFFATSTVSDSIDATWPQVAVGIDKKLNVVWIDNLGITADDIKFDQCTVTFSPFIDVVCGTDVFVATIQIPDNPLLGTNFKMSWFPYLAVDNAPGGSGFIYIIWTGKNANGNTDIYFARSDWQTIDFQVNPPVAIANSTRDEFFPAISVDENHFVRVVYYRRVDIVTDRFDVYEIFSGDAGNSWSAPTKINDVGPIHAQGETFIGDYIGIDTKIERHPGWADSRAATGGDFDVYSAVVGGC